MNEKPDLSTLLSILMNKENKNTNPEELLTTFIDSSSNRLNNNPSAYSTTNSSENKKDSNSDYSSSNAMPDMEMIMKLMQIMKTSNQDSPSKDLLKSLKPFLNDSRKEKIDQYIKILGMTKALEIFNELGDHSK